MATNGAYVGRDIAVFYSLSQDNTTVPSDYVPLGYVRNKEFGPEWETVDTTADSSPGQSRERLVTYKSEDVSLAGISRQDEVQNQERLLQYVETPTNGQPCGWVRTYCPDHISRQLAAHQRHPCYFHLLP